MKKSNTCAIHDKEISDIKIEFSEFKTEFGGFKVTVSKKLDELMILVNKPIFKDSQVAGIVIMAVVYTIMVMMYLTPTSAKADANEKDNLRQDKEIIKQEKKSAEIITLLLDIKEIVDKNEGAKEAEAKIKQ
jgi:hypothetical protein